VTEILTGVLLAIPVIWILLVVTLGAEVLQTAALVVGAFALASAGIWLLLRPSGFVIDDHALVVRWPLRSMTVPRSSIRAVRVLYPGAMQRELGFSARVGFGGLFGSFGFIYTQRQGWVLAFVTSMSAWVLIERTDGRTLLLSPERPDELARALAGA